MPGSLGGGGGGGEEPHTTHSATDSLRGPVEV